MKSLGIDLGTTHTVAAVDGEPLPISACDGRATLPSVVSFVPSGPILVGLPAKRRRGVDPANTVHSAKRIIGRRWMDGATQRFCERYPFPLVETPDGWPAFETRAGRFTPTQIASIVLGAVLEQAKDLPGGFDRTVITVPAGFTAAQCNATLDAAQEAGLGHVRIVEEPMATAWAYRDVRNPVSRAGVYDLGGGTFEFSIVDWSGERPRLVAVESNLLLGGDEVDLVLADWVNERVLQERNWDLRSYAEVHARLLSACEQAKVRLGFFDETRLDLREIDSEIPPGEDALTLSADLLDRLTAGLVRQTFLTCDAVLSAAGLRPADLDAVFLAGGSTHLRSVRAGVEAYFGQPGRFELEPTTVVAIGASRAEL